MKRLNWVILFMLIVEPLLAPPSCPPGLVTKSSPNITEYMARKEFGVDLVKNISSNDENGPQFSLHLRNSSSSECKFTFNIAKNRQGSGDKCQFPITWNSTKVNVGNSDAVEWDPTGQNETKIELHKLEQGSTTLYKAFLTGNNNTLELPDQSKECFDLNDGSIKFSMEFTEQPSEGCGIAQLRLSSDYIWPYVMVNRVQCSIDPVPTFASARVSTPSNGTPTGNTQGSNSTEETPAPTSNTQGSESTVDALTPTDNTQGSNSTEETPTPTGNTQGSDATGETSTPTGNTQGSESTEGALTPTGNTQRSDATEKTGPPAPVNPKITTTRSPDVHGSPEVVVDTTNNPNSEPSTDPTRNSSLASTIATTDGGGLPAWVIIVIVVGGILALVFVVICLYICVFRMKKSKNEAEPDAEAGEAAAADDDANAADPEDKADANAAETPEDKTAEEVHDNGPEEEAGGDAEGEEQKTQDEEKKDGGSKDEEEKDGSSKEPQQKTRGESEDEEEHKTQE